MLTLDTSGYLALVNCLDPDHVACKQVFDEDRGPYFISTAILSEIAWFLETRFGQDSNRLLIQDLRDGAFALDWHRTDLERMEALIARDDDLPLGIADAAVVACAERNGGRVLTSDRRHFSVVARGERSLTVLPR